MNKKRKIGSGILAVVVLLMASVVYLHGHTFQVLQPAGQIAGKERNLIIFGALLSLIVVVPVFVLLGVFAWKYRETNTKAKYSPELEGSKLAETIWWLVPSLLILVLSITTWRSSFALDPYKSLASSHKAVHVQVVALDWKWLFIYPDQHIASVNELALPVDTPVDFELTSDSVMNSFWVPQLGGQMYAMPGMVTQLHLEANKTGQYRGMSANISGKGFADMKFMAKAMPTVDFNAWVQKAASSANGLTQYSYTSLTHPSTAVKPTYYNSVDNDLYETTVMKYMMPEGNISKGSAL